MPTEVTPGWSGGSRPLAVVFDLDGTLIDSAGDIAQAVNFALTTRGLPTRSLQEVRGFIGDGSRKLVERAAAPVAHGIEELLASFESYYCANPAEHTVLLPHVSEVLALLDRQYPLALCTNKPREMTQAVLSALGLSEWFRCVVAGGDCAQNKPDPAPLELVARQLGMAPSSLLMVGDGPQDVRCAQAVGALSVGLLDGVFGHTGAVVRCRPDALVRLRYLPWLLECWTVRRP